jgi:hypothetical protein
MIGVPGGLNLAFVPSDNVSGADGEMLISLNKPHKPSDYYRRLIREQLADEFPGTTIYFQTADIVSQVLNFGLAAPISIQIQDQNLQRSMRRRSSADDEAHSGRGDPRIRRCSDFPTLEIEVDRQRAASLPSRSATSPTTC